MPKTNGTKKKSVTKKNRINQSDFPLYDIEKSLLVAQAIKDNYASQPTAPLLVAEACDISPSSSNWRYLSRASVAYEITTGSYQAKQIDITPLGRKIVSPLSEGDDLLALIEAIQKPRILGEFYAKYNGSKLPKDNILENVFESMGIPREKIKSAIEIMRKNAKKAGILREINGNEYIYLETSKTKVDSDTRENTVDDEIEKTTSTDEVPIDLFKKMELEPPMKSAVKEPLRKNIFISHGKNNTKIIKQLKEIIDYGEMTPIISVERETTAIPVPDKVFDDMRTCSAGIIHIDLEEVALEDGTTYKKLNENVLIEIGAAIALYNKRVILLCKKGTSLPSNLQGLYKSEYEGNELSGTSVMKLLKTLKDLREKM